MRAVTIPVTAFSCLEGSKGMGNLTNPKRIREIMKQYDKHFSKALGQNFLIEESVLDEIVTGSGIDRDVCVLEIGPGIGVLTEKLAQSAKKSGCSGD